MIPLVVAGPVSLRTSFIKQWLDDKDFAPVDCFWISPKRAEFTIGQIHEIQAEIKLIYLKKRAFILDNFDQANQEAQNAFLKTLEERTENNQFLLAVTNIDKLLPTIISRAKLIRLDNSHYSVDSTVFDIYKRLQAKDLTLLTDKNLSLDREEAIKMCDGLALAVRSYHPTQSQTMRLILQTKKLLEQNVNVQMAIDQLFLTLLK